MHFCGNPMHDAPMALALAFFFRRRIAELGRAVWAWVRR